MKDFSELLQEINKNYSDCELEESYIYNASNKIIGFQLAYYADNYREVLIDIQKYKQKAVRVYAETDTNYTEKVFNNIKPALNELKKYNIEIKTLDTDLSL